MRHKPPRNYENTPTTAANDRQAKTWRIRLKELMEKENVSQRKLAELAGLGPTSIRHAITKNGTITIETLRRLSNAFNKPLGYLLTGQSVSIEVKGNDDVPLNGVVIHVHGPHQHPWEGEGRGHVFVSKDECGADPFALEVEDNSMMGIGSNFQPDLNDIIVPGEIVVWDLAADVAPGDLVVVDLGEVGRPKYSVRMLEQDEGDYYVAALTRTYGRVRIDPKFVSGPVTSVVRRRTR